MLTGVSPELVESAFTIGHDLAARDQDIVSAVNQLNLNLVTAGCKPAVEADEVRGSWPEESLIIASPPFRRAVRSATASIIAREDGLAAALPPPGSEPVNDPVSDEPRGDAAWVPSEAFNLEKTIAQSSEGMTWVDPDEASYRAAIVTRNSMMLKAVINGLAARGYDRRSSAQDMRQEFNESLDALWRRGSYHAFPASRVVASIMRKTGVHHPADTVRAAQRFHSFGRDYGYGLALMRLLPDTVLAEL